MGAVVTVNVLAVFAVLRWGGTGWGWGRGRGGGSAAGSLGRNRDNIASLPAVTSVLSPSHELGI